MRTFRYAQLKRHVTWKPDPGKYEINRSFKGSRFVRKIYQYLFDVMLHNKFLVGKVDHIETVVFDYTHEKMKLASHNVAKIINNYEMDYNIRIRRDTHLIVCGEEDFYEMINDRNNNAAPMFYNEVSFPLDIRRNGYYEGFHLHVCPGLSGFAILPKKIVEK